MGKIKETPISKQLREYAGNPNWSHGDCADTMLAAADEIDEKNARIAKLETVIEFAKDAAENVENYSLADMLEIKP